MKKISKEKAKWNKTGSEKFRNSTKNSKESFTNILDEMEDWISGIADKLELDHSVEENNSKNGTYRNSGTM